MYKRKKYVEASIDQNRDEEILSQKKQKVSFSNDENNKPFIRNECEHSFGKIEELTSHLSTVHDCNEDSVTNSVPSSKKVFEKSFQLQS